MNDMPTTLEYTGHLIDVYRLLVKIKSEISETSPTLEYELRTLAAKLSTAGVTIEDLNK